jgi:3-hydroxyacyl-CoA dehydrogenase
VVELRPIAAARRAFDLGVCDDRAVLDIENHCADEFPHLPTNVPELLKSHVDAGKLGVKAGEGFYPYPAQAWHKTAFPEVAHDQFER